VVRCTRPSQAATSSEAASASRLTRCIDWRRLQAAQLSGSGPGCVGVLARAQVVGKRRGARPVAPNAVASPPF
jgi:hypothetical protein